MLKSSIKLIIILFLAGFSTVFSQKDESYKKYVDWAWKGKFDPMIDVSFGQSRMDHYWFTSKFANTGAVNVMLGYSEIVPYKKYVVSLDERFIFGGYNSTELAMEEAAVDEMLVDLQRFGAGTRTGYGYEIGPIELLLYSQGTFLWTKIQSVNTDAASEEDRGTLDLFENTFRFGHSFELGGKFRLIKSLSVNIGAEASFVYPRHIFWPWLGSYMIMAGSFSILGTFGDDIVDASPLLGPLIYFALKAGLAIVFYNQVQEKMNWPFESDPPLTYETIKIGGTLTF